ncbi:MAG: HD-GYP domain-containing protein [Lachnospiraceae bacterium]|nr:HD-GYP domain-containing protein [Lachnospiraceae bacterium]
MSKAVKAASSMGGRSNRIDRLADTIKFVLVIVFTMNLLIMTVALLDRNNSDEANIGIFDATSYNEGWKMSFKGEVFDVTLPFYADAESGDEIIISNTLPPDVSNGMNLMVRASMEDVVIYIDGRAREEYSTKSVRGMSYYIPSAYVVVPINAPDSGKEITVHLTVKAKGSVNAITIGHGNNGWFKVIREGLPVSIIALAAFVSGILISLAAVLLGRRYRTKSAVYLGILVMDVTMWLFSESVMRQLIFSRPSLSQYFSYITLELIGPLACMYFDEVQHGKYHRRYLVIEAICLFQIVINIILAMAHVADFYVTLPVCHVLSAVCAVIIIVCIVSDIRTGRVRSYYINMMGGIFFIAFCLFELSRFYFAEFVIFGAYVCIGLIGLMIATVLQTIHDVFEEFRAHERQRTDMMNNTIETIAGAIDARDEYTGGHSERVGLYAQLLAREIASEYDLTEEDILRIHYIGLVHDIGKIGVADSVLNKAGKLTGEEYSLMKRHTEIGYELMNSMGSEIEGVLDGVRSHHERFDGTGYPDALKGEDIPLVARILCIADSYDAMTSNRVYRKRLTNDEVQNELDRCSESQFDPRLVQAFIKLLERGGIRENTVEGMAVDNTGKVTRSALLESRLQSDLLEGAKIVHPSHIRMLCYILKLMEKKGEDYQVVFVGPSDDTMTGTELSSFIKKISNTVSSRVGGHDLTLRYTDRLSIAALYNRTAEEAQAFAADLVENCPGISTEIM